MSNVGQGANKPYPQEVTLDAAKAEAAQMQSEASKAHGGAIPKNDPASAARVRLRNSSDRSDHAALSVQRLLGFGLQVICLLSKFGPNTSLLPRLTIDVRRGVAECRLTVTARREHLDFRRPGQRSARERSCQEREGC